MRFLGHSRNGNGLGVDEALSDHLQATAARAAEFASEWGAGRAASVAGLIHDLGKYADQFQNRVRGNDARGRDHWTAGVVDLLCRYGERAVAGALAIQGHHTGLQRWPTEAALQWASDLCAAMGRDAERYTSPDVGELRSRMAADGLVLPLKLADTPALDDPTAATMLDVRMLFSALVDADFLETEAHFNGDALCPRRPRRAGPVLDPARALAQVEREVQRARVGGAAADVQRVRDALLTDCLNAAEQAPGLFTLSAPTGSGKTLAMLAFGLAHARRHGLRRVVTVMPFLNIVDQTARVYHRLFDPAAGFERGWVAEDHSNVDAPIDPGPSRSPLEDRPAHDDPALLRRLVAENWDAPIVLTTSVQLLESLHAHRPAACRKLHRLARSVILIDEVQTLPTDLATATLATLARLSERYGATVVLATATQPAFDHLDEQVRPLAAVGWRPREIVRDPAALFAPAARRVQVAWRHRQPVAWADLADELADRAGEQWLVVVNLKRHADELLDALRRRGVPNVLHLSTRLCPAHRLAVLGRVGGALPDGRPVRLVSTQCIEAGVDLDFPVVYRALAPLEAVAQAAGRCNRHGTRPAPGQVHVFLPNDPGRRLYPGGSYQQAAAVAANMLNLWSAGNGSPGEVLHDPTRLRAYFRHLYDASGLRPKDKALHRAILAEGDFVEVAKLYRLITGDTINVLVPYDPATFDRLRRDIEGSDPRTPDFIRQWIARARPHAVSIFRPPPEGADTTWSGLCPIQFSRRHRVENHDADWFVCLRPEDYDADVYGYRPATDFDGVI